MTLDLIVRNARRIAKPGERFVVLKRNVFNAPTYVLRAYDPRYISQPDYVCTVEK